MKRISFIKIRELDIKEHNACDYAIIFIYIFDNNKKVALIRRKIYIIDNLFVKALININIIKFKAIILDISKNLAIIKFYNSL